MDARILPTMRTLLPSLFVLGACGGPSASAPPPSAPLARAPAAPIGGCDKPDSGEELRASDVDEDGRPEVCKYYREFEDPARPGQRRAVLVRQAIDVNFDGRTDLVRLFDSNGGVTKETWDHDFDGRIDEVRTFEGGVLVRSERDHNGDGQMSVFRYYADGKLERKESDTNGDGQIDRWEYFRDRVLERVGVDKNHDGTVDTWSRAPTAG